MNMLKQQMTSAFMVEEYAGFGDTRTCLAGLYLLTDQGTLARFDAEGRLTEDTELTARLSPRLQTVLSQYRSGGVGDLSLGLIVDSELEQPWSTGTLYFSDRALNELLDAGRCAGASMTQYEQMDRTTTVRRGWELFLDGSRPLQPRLPGYCPVLFVPEAACEVLRERYGADFAVNRELFEVLDLSAPLAPNDHLPHELLSMIRTMRATQLDGDAHAVPGESTGEMMMEAFSSQNAGGFAAPFADPGNRADGVLAPPADSCFNDGDPVTGWLLEWFTPFNELTEMQRDIIAGYETIRKGRSGQRLIERGTREDVCIYLVEGSLALEGPDGGTMLVKAGTRRSRLPISVLTPHAYNVTATTDVSIIVFSQKLVRRVIEIATTYTSLDSRQDSGASTAAISNGVQALYLNPASRDRHGTG